MNWKRLALLAVSFTLIDIFLLRHFGVPFPYRMGIAFIYGWFFDSMLQLLGIDLGDKKDEDGE